MKTMVMVGDACSAERGGQGWCGGGLGLKPERRRKKLRGAFNGWFETREEKRKKLGGGGSGG
jgi:hypothetical protein